MFFLIILSACQIQLRSEDIFVPYVEQGNIGVLNKRTNHKVTAAIYDNIHDAQNGCIWVKKNKKWSLIDSVGATVLYFNYNIVNNFSEGFSYVCDSVRCGFINIKGDFKIIIPYQNARPFSNGFSAVLQDGLWSYIDTTGKLLTPFKYDEVFNFNDDVGIVHYDDIYGFIDKNGKEIFYPKYESIIDFDKGAARVRYEAFTTHYGVIDKNGNEIIKPDCHDVNEFTDNLLQFDNYYYSFIYNKTLHKITDTVYDIFHRRFYQENYASYGFGNSQQYIDTNLNILTVDDKYRTQGSFENKRCRIYNNDKFGFIDEKGNLIIPAIFDDADDFYNGLAPVKKDDKWGFIDTSGNVVINFQFDEPNSFFDGIAVAKQNGKYGYIDMKGNWIVQPKFSKVGSATDGYLECFMNGKAGMLDYLGNNIIPFEFKEFRQYEDGFFHAQKYIGEESDDYVVGLYTATGKKIIPVEYERIDYLGNNLYKVRSNEKYYGIYNTDGEIVLPVKYDAIRAFDEIYYVCENDLCGIMDKNLNWILKPTYLTIKEPMEGFIYVETTEGKSGFINKKGEVIGQIKYNVESFHYSWRSYTPKFNRGRAILPVGEKFGMINQQGKEILQPIYDDILELPLSGYTVWNKNVGAVMDSNGTFLTDFIYNSYSEIGEGIAKIKQNNKYGLLNENGKEICKPIYDEIGKMDFSIAEVKLGFKHGAIDRNGKIVIPVIYDGLETHYNSDICTISMKWKEGIVKRDGTVLLEPQFDRCEVINERIIMVKKDKKWALLNLSEPNKPLEFIYDDIKNEDLKTVIVKKDNKYGLINEFGKMTIPIMYDYLEEKYNVFYQGTLNGQKFDIDKNNRALK